ncbi:thioredoxin domain-containing protein [Clostridium senegalense]|uniref:Thioredoxin domain-containing protein n=1 Tax=Clostridium senegalense TaxID=1465809 RepID=A0A6M0H752_9CLOT|nr:thioredoxin domain-containing protein [Clostridium senegalense]NEU06367.1 thioredoxin domain-containing protein [Clostridium senegalense]
MVTNQKVPNNLINEKSPYLFQHAYNPVNWYSWCDEAFEKAKDENKPIFLSIGYSTCHWCHVMAHECFEDDEVAKILNDNFISIKVDREERPDVDSIYMTVCQAFTGGGGWPLNLFITPDQKPFYAGTYFPKHAKYNVPGFMDILSSISDQWKSDKERIIDASEDVMRQIQNAFQPTTTDDEIGKDIIEGGYLWCLEFFDVVNGGFDKAPKFPTPHKLMFLLKYYKLENEPKALEMVEKTLNQMYRGGIFDHIGYGFSRYSTDDKWLVPHFEKMLYDNALLTMAYLETYSITKKEFYKNVAVKTMDYVLRELTSDEGGFYCAQDADSEGDEGKFYVFNPLEICEVLGEDDGKYFNNYFDITTSGNFEGKSIANLLKNNSFENDDEKINDLRKKVFNYRLERTTLHKDEKILTSWNALMITAFAKAYSILKDEKYLKVCKDAIAFIENNLVNKDNRLLARYKDGDVAYFAYLEDYAFLIWSFIELYEGTNEKEYLEKAISLNSEMIDKFWDENSSGFFLYGKDSEKLIARPKEIYDGAIPSGNSVAAYVLVKLSKITKDEILKDITYNQLKYFSSTVKNSPISYTMYLIALMNYL